LIADRVEHLGAPRCVDMCRLLPASRPPSSASGIRTTVLRLWYRNPPSASKAPRQARRLPAASRSD